MSAGKGLIEMGYFGGDHTDDMDLAAGLSAMVIGSDLPETYEAGRFHLLSLGVYVDLGSIHVVYFSGRLRHSGTPPLAPPGTEEIAHWAYRFVLILYPASRLMLGTTKTVLAAQTSGDKTDKPLTVPPELFHPKWVLLFNSINYQAYYLIYQCTISILHTCYPCKGWWYYYVT